MTLGTLILPGHYKFIYFDVFEFTLVGRIWYERKNLDISYSTNQDILTKNDCNKSFSSTFSVSTHPFLPRFESFGKFVRTLFQSYCYQIQLVPYALEKLAQNAHISLMSQVHYQLLVNFTCSSKVDLMHNPFTSRPFFIEKSLENRVEIVNRRLESYLTKGKRLKPCCRRNRKCFRCHSRTRNYIFG